MIDFEISLHSCYFVAILIMFDENYNKFVRSTILQDTSKSVFKLKFIKLGKRITYSNTVIDANLLHFCGYLLGGFYSDFKLIIWPKIVKIF